MRPGECECTGAAREPAAGVGGQQAPPEDHQRPPPAPFDDPTGRARVLRRVADESRIVAPGDLPTGPDVSWERGVGDVPVYSRPWPSSGVEPSRAQSYQGTTGSFTATDLQDYAPYAERSLRAADASGGWVASVYDLGLFLRECFVRRALFTDRRWYGQMFQYQGPRGPANGLGYGWDLTGSKGYFGVEKGGHLDGGAAYVYNQLTASGSRGLSLAMVYNRFPFSRNETNDRSAESTLRSNLRAALGAINLPAGPRDLFRELARRGGCFPASRWGRAPRIPASTGWRIPQMGWVSHRSARRSVGPPTSTRSYTFAQADTR